MKERIPDVCEGTRNIECNFPIGTVSKIGEKERYLHGRTPHSIHVWWARRPFSAIRSVIFSSLINPSEEAKYLTEKLGSSVQPSLKTVNKARKIILSDNQHEPPKLLDIFGGGGTIPLEAARLGCLVETIDINPLSCFIQKTILNYSQTIPHLPDLIEKYGKELLDKLKEETQSLYRRDCTQPPAESRVAFIWGQTVQCSSCNNRISLLRNGWISKKKKHKVYLYQTPNFFSGDYNRKLVFNPTKDYSTKKWSISQGIVCPFCNTKFDRKQFQQLAKTTLSEELLCIRVGRKRNRTYIMPEPLGDFYPSEKELKDSIKDELERIGSPLPKIKLPNWSGIVNPPLYGIDSYMKLFNLRQLVVLLKTIRSLRDKFQELLDSGFSNEQSIAIISFLSAFVDQLVDWNCRLSMWIKENQQVGRALSGPGIPMLWSYSEIDPFQNGPANLYSKLKRIIAAVESIPIFPEKVNVNLISATHLPFPSNYFEAVVTDPPYADNLFYSVLSECIYVWKRMLFEDIIPELFNTPNILREEELVAPRYKMPFSKAMKLYEKNLTKALKEVVRVLKKDGILSFFFTHGTFEAWELILNSFHNGGLEITGWWPLVLERGARPRGMNATAVNVSVVIVARPINGVIKTSSWQNVEIEIKKSIETIIKELEPFDWNEAKLASAVFTKAMGVVAMSGQIVDGKTTLTCKESLEKCFQITRTRFPLFNIARARKINKKQES